MTNKKNTLKNGLIGVMALALSYMPNIANAENQRNYFQVNEQMKVEYTVDKNDENIISKIFHDGVLTSEDRNLDGTLETIYDNGNQIDCTGEIGLFNSYTTPMLKDILNEIKMQKYVDLGKKATDQAELTANALELPYVNKNQSLKDAFKW